MPLKVTVCALTTGALCSQGQSEALVRVTAQLFDDIQSVAESKQLAPVLRTQACPRHESQRVLCPEHT